MFTVFETLDQGLHLLLSKLLYILAPGPRKLGSSGPVVAHAFRKGPPSFPAVDVTVAAVVIFFRCSGYTLVTL